MAQEHDLFDDIIEISKGFDFLKNPLGGVTDALDPSAPQWNPADYKERPRGNTIPCLTCKNEKSGCTACSRAQSCPTAPRCRDDPPCLCWEKTERRLQHPVRRARQDLRLRPQHRHQRRAVQGGPGPSRRALRRALPRPRRPALHEHALLARGPLSLSVSGAVPLQPHRLRPLNGQH